MSKKSDLNLSVATVLIILCAVFYFNIMTHGPGYSFNQVPGYNRTRQPSIKKNCVSNMKTIEGAVELYQMENWNPKNGNIAKIDVETLQKNGYLKSIPRCPGNGLYTITVAAPADMKSAQYRMTEIECQVHGRLSLQETTDRDKGIK